MLTGLPFKVLTLRGQAIDSAKVVVADRPYEEEIRIPPSIDDISTRTDVHRFSKSILDWESHCYRLALSREDISVAASADDFWRTLVFNLSKIGEVANTKLHQSYKAWKRSSNLLVSLYCDKTVPARKPLEWSPPGMRNISVCFEPEPTFMELPTDLDGKMKMLKLITRQLAVGYEFGDCFMTCSFGRCFFITCAGYIGWAPKDAQEGDRLCLFSGSDIPYLIRPKGNEGFLLIGACYVHGLMNGKARELGLGGEVESISLV